jgi:protein TonB
MTRLAPALAVALALLAGTAQAQGELRAPDTPYLRRPSAADLLRFYPPAALARHVSGRASLACQVAPSGRLDGCSLVAEDPPGFGFGEAALRMAPLWRLRPLGGSDRPGDAARIVVPVRFAPPPEAAR